MKRSWLWVQQPVQGQRCRVQRLRHTFSSPEAFNANELNLPYPDFLSYGTNLPHERSSSNFGSELSRDPSSYSFEKRARLVPAEPNDLEDCSGQTLQSQLDPHSDSEAEQQVSCFGTVTQRPKRRRVRSRSFSNARGGGSGARRRLRQRSSSADLLIYATMQKEETDGSGEGQRLFFI